MGSFQMFTSITGSAALGAVLAIGFASGGIAMVFTPDFSKGIFLDMLLADQQHMEKITSSTKANLIFNLVIFDLVFIPIVSYFLIIPLASQTETFGSNTYIISIVMWTITCLSLIPGALFQISVTLSAEIGRMWNIQINNYLKSIRNILLQCNENDIEANAAIQGKDFTEKIFVEYERVEKWAREVNKKTANVYSATLTYSFGFAFVSVAMIAIGVGGKNRTASIVVLSLFTFCMLNWGISYLFTIAKPSLAWETAKVKFLNDPRVQRAIAKIGWSERWDNWLHLHELNASRVYGVKVTMSAMRNVSSALASFFAIVMYFLLRNELRQLTAV